MNEHAQKLAPQVAIILGSASDVETLSSCRKALDNFGISHELKILSAHRTPDELVAYVRDLQPRAVQLVIAAAGMAAALPGVVAAHTLLPVIGVPLAAGVLAGVDALLSVAQMPSGVPVACMGIGEAGGKNAAYLAARILALHDKTIETQTKKVLAADRQKVLDAKIPGETKS